ncbi:hypothetical protein [Campylobacter geochelonis]|uniref:hypothetical protein n=1 Tax=Campylobacter geochelonis TaxID=1780362 RepID=UPI000770A0CB|nr:hypothetical protein [Campylobacter geochelonis]CZE49818.1 NHLP leader peptide domain [Campylobacter geochelonis]
MLTNKTFLFASLALFTTNSYSSSQDMLDIFKYSKIPDYELLRIWTSPIYRQSVLDNPYMLFPEDAKHKFFQAYNLKDEDSLNFSIPFLSNRIINNESLKKQISNLSKIDKLSNILPLSILTKALSDDGFKSDLIKNPNKILADFGYDTKGFKVNIFKDTDRLKNIIIPPSGLNEQELAYYEFSA